LANPVIDAHFKRLKARHPEAMMEYLKSGAALICVPQRPVPTTWSAPEVAIRFIAPPTYSVAAPDCFWVDPNISLPGGGLPKNSALNKDIPETQLRGHWFSWHVEGGHWMPNEHDLLAWLSSCMTRLQTIQ
jgi:hypothetical protein